MIQRHQLVFSVVVMVALLIDAPASRADDQLPVISEENFDDPSAVGRWQPTDDQAWKIEKSDKGGVYSQFKKRSAYEPPHRSPYNISLLKDVVVGDFQLDVKVLSTHPDYGHRDVCLVFGYQNPAQFYYVHLGKKADDHANQIFIVDNKPRTKISLKSTPGTDWDDKWHNIRIVRRVGDGTINVYYDDMQEPVMVAKDKSFVWGQIGLGSFDDTSNWDDLVLRGTKVEKP